MWLIWRCHTALRGEKIPLMGLGGLKDQCFFYGYEGLRHYGFHAKVKNLLAKRQGVLARVSSPARNRRSAARIACSSNN
jgi:hypothetical protein